MYENVFHRAYANKSSERSRVFVYTKDANCFDIWQKLSATEFVQSIFHEIQAISPVNINAQHSLSLLPFCAGASLTTLKIITMCSTKYEFLFQI